MFRKIYIYKAIILLYLAQAVRFNSKMSEDINAKKDLPVFKLKSGLIDAAVWQQTSDKGDFLTVTIHRSYKDKDDKWRTTNSFRVSDLPRVETLLRKCYEFSVLNESN